MVDFGDKLAEILVDLVILAQNIVNKYLLRNFKK